MSKQATKAPAAGKKKPAAKKKSKKVQPKGLAAFTEKGSVPKWITAARAVMVLAFATTVPVILGVESGRRLFWAGAIAVLPLFWVVGGYHLWRRICPLAVLAQLGRYVGKPGGRRVQGWLAKNYLLVQLTVMLVALSLRLIMTNGTIYALVGFISVATLTAIVIGFVYTGKTWCNYICPVGMVEKFYTEPAKLGGPTNSQCSPCTACKKNCPDIDLEQGYWKEMSMPARRIAYYSWPGIVFAFYFYYYLVSGTWDYYFSGIWCFEGHQVKNWLSDGFYFVSGIPVAAAAPLTLLGFGAVSFGTFSLAERIALAWHKRQAPDSGDPTIGDRIRHRTLATAGFVAFITFYFYGGQPTIRLAPPWVGTGITVIVVIAASAIFFRRWGRNEAEFVQEKFAEKILKKWQWGDAPPSSRLQDIYLVHTERANERKQRLSAYKETVREMVADGLVTRNELVLLDSLRAQLSISDKDHKQIMAELSEEDRQLFDPDYQGSVELRIQQQAYLRDLEFAITAAGRAGVALPDQGLESIRLEHNVSHEEHEAAVDNLLGLEGPLAALFRAEVRQIDDLAAAHHAAVGENTGDRPSTSYAFLANLCKWRAGQRADRALSLLAPLAGAELAVQLHGALVGASVARREAATDALRQALPGELCEALVKATGSFTADNTVAAKLELLLPLLADSSVYLRAAAVYILARFDDPVAREAIEKACGDDDALVRETALNALGEGLRKRKDLRELALKDDPRVRRVATNIMGWTSSADPAGDSQLAATLNTKQHVSSLITLETMMLISLTPLFGVVDPDDLEQMAALVEERHFAAGEDLCVEGDEGDDVFMLMSGNVEVWSGPSRSKKVLAQLSDGATIGEMAVLEPAPRSATVTATSPTRALVLPGRELESLMMSRPAIGQGIIRVLVDRLRGMINNS